MDNLFGERYFGRVVAWHKKGTVFTGKKTLVEGIQESGCDYDVTLEAIPSIPMPMGTVEIKNSLAVIRHPVPDDNQYQFLGLVSDHYKIISNKTLAEIFNSLSELWPLETIGSLGKGETVFFSLDAGEIEINGDLVHQYYLITDNKIGKKCTQIMYTPVRVVCENTLIAGEKESVMTVNIRHSRDNIYQIQNVAGLTEGLIKKAEQVNNLFGIMGKTNISISDFKTAVETLYPIPTKKENIINVSTDFEYLTRKALESREQVMVMYDKMNQEYPQNSGNVWNAWNAVVEWEDYKKSRGDGDIASLLFGQRANTKVQAIDLLMK